MTVLCGFFRHMKNTFLWRHEATANNLVLDPERGQKHHREKKANSRISFTKRQHSLFSTQIAHWFQLLFISMCLEEKSFSLSLSSELMLTPWCPVQIMFRHLSDNIKTTNESTFRDRISWTHLRFLCDPPLGAELIWNDKTGDILYVIKCHEKTQTNNDMYTIVDERSQSSR